MWDKTQSDGLENVQNELEKASKTLLELESVGTRARLRSAMELWSAGSGNRNGNAV